MRPTERKTEHERTGSLAAVRNCSVVQGYLRAFRGNPDLMLGISPGSNQRRQNVRTPPWNHWEARGGGMGINGFIASPGSPDVQGGSRIDKLTPLYSFSL